MDATDAHHLAHAIHELTEAIKGHNQTTKILCRIEQSETKIMSKFTDWAEAQEADQADIKASLDGISTGVANLEKLITDFQNSPGTLSAADQDRLDAIQAASKALVAKAKDIKTDAPA